LEIGFSTPHVLHGTHVQVNRNALQSQALKNNGKLSVSAQLER